MQLCGRMLSSVYEAQNLILSTINELKINPTLMWGTRPLKKRLTANEFLGKSCITRSNMSEWDDEVLTLDQTMETPARTGSKRQNKQF